MWSPEFNELPEHEITRGVKPFSIRDEWYFNMRFRPDGQGIIPILSAKPNMPPSYLTATLDGAGFAAATGFAGAFSSGRTWPKPIAANRQMNRVENSNFFIKVLVTNL